MSVVTPHRAAVLQERYRLITGWLTHLNTLCAGSIVVIGSFAARATVSGGVWAALAMTAFGVAIVCGLLAQFLFAVNIGEQVPGQALPARTHEALAMMGLVLAAMSLFVLTLLFLIVFGFMNLT